LAFNLAKTWMMETESQSKESEGAIEIIKPFEILCKVVGDLAGKIFLGSPESDVNIASDHDQMRSLDFRVKAPFRESPQ
jgi:hypothetical protein